MNIGIVFSGGLSKGAFQFGFAKKCWSILIIPI